MTFINKNFTARSVLVKMSRRDGQPCGFTSIRKIYKNGNFVLEGDEDNRQWRPRSMTGTTADATNDEWRRFPFWVELYNPVKHDSAIENARKAQSVRALTADINRSLQSGSLSLDTLKSMKALIVKSQADRKKAKEE